MKKIGAARREDGRDRRPHGVSSGSHLHGGILLLACSTSFAVYARGQVEPTLRFLLEIVVQLDRILGPLG